MRPVMLLATGRKCAITRETLRRKRVRKREWEGGEGEGEKEGRGQGGSIQDQERERGRGVEMEGKHTDAANVSFILFAPIYRQGKGKQKGRSEIFVVALSRSCSKISAY